MRYDIEFSDSMTRILSHLRLDTDEFSDSIFEFSDSILQFSDSILNWNIGMKLRDNQQTRLSQILINFVMEKIS